jgi:lipid-A-disaccharide synthase
MWPRPSKAPAVAGDPGTVFIVAGEPSGDLLGAAFMRALRARRPGVRFTGVGGSAMAGEGLSSLFPMSDIAVMGIGPVVARLPLILRRIRETTAAALAAEPNLVLLVDSPDFCKRVGRKLKAARPATRIAVYVSPTVWAWRPGRARRLSGFADRLLALLPFEPEVHRVLGGPDTRYVGHPILDAIGDLRPADGRGAAPLAAGRRPNLVVLPGSRLSEVTRLMEPFGAALGLLRDRIGAFDLVLPAVDHVAPTVEAEAARWPVAPRIVRGTAAKHAAFRAADAALAASGTVTLELAVAAVPMVTAYRLDWLGRRVKPFIRRPAGLETVVPVLSAVLPNVIGADEAVPILIDDACRPEEIALLTEALLRGGPARERQLRLFDKVLDAMRPAGSLPPGEAAAAAVLDLLDDPARG